MKFSLFLTYFALWKELDLSEVETSKMPFKLSSVMKVFMLI